MKRIQLENRTDLKSEIPLRTPYCIFIDPSSACNFKCVFCMNQKIKRPTVMRFDLYKKLIDDLGEFEDPVKTLRLYAFGEPLMNPAFCDMVQYAKRCGRVLNVDTTSNASLLTPELSRRLVDSGLDRINISIEAMNTKKYREFTRNEAVTFDGIVRGIADLYAIKSNLVIFVKIAGDYLDEQEKELFTRTFAPISDGCGIEHTMNCWKNFEVDGVNKELNVYGGPRKEVMVCPYVFYSFLVQADGIVSSCFLDWNKKLVIGDAKNESLKTLWSDKVLEHLRRLMLRKERKQHPVCADCDQLAAGMPVELDAFAAGILSGLVQADEH